MKPFRYLRDPLFLACVAAYLVNRLVLRPHLDVAFLHNHFNDLICIPFWVPVLAWLRKKLRLRPFDTPPTALEIVVPLLLWSWMFEVWLPGTHFAARPFVGDPRDVMWYAVGALGAAAWWCVTYAAGPTRPAPQPDQPAGAPPTARPSPSRHGATAAAAQSACPRDAAPRPAPPPR